MPEDQIKEAPAGVIHESREQKLTQAKMTDADQRYAISRYNKRVLTDRIKNLMSDAELLREVWE